MKRPAPHRLLLAYYADDFTGSTDALESLARAGLKTVLFLEPPTPAQLAKFRGVDAFGIVGGARVMSPREMALRLPPAFKVLKKSGAPIVHYKTCSTFDSSARVGSIGKAIDIGREIFGQQPTPLVVGFPAFGRHVVFGNLFARSGTSEIFRLDRHPMSRHPVTPMNESDLRLHLCRQTRLSAELIDILALKSCRLSPAELRSRVRAASRQPAVPESPGAVQFRLERFATRSIPPVVLFDTLDEDDLPVIGRLIANLCRPGRQLFCAGSSGLGYALTAHWKELGLIKAPPPSPRRLPRNKQLLMVSGSCSPVTDRQIGCALKAGFAEVACDAEALADSRRAEKAIETSVTAAARAMAAQRHVIFHTARGLADPRCAGFDRAVRRTPGRNWWRKTAAARATLGRSMGRILELALQQSNARRLVICGGDTATAAGTALGIQALEFLAPAATGAPWCLAHAPGRLVDRCQLICKGGQVGADDFLARLAEPQL